MFVVGDDDQSIYGWRGAKVENVRKFLHDFPGARTIRLEQNYRSSGNILDAANAVIAHNPAAWAEPVDRGRHRRRPSTCTPRTTRSTRRGSWSNASASGCATAAPSGEAAILYRSNAQSRAFEESLLAEQVPYRVYGGMRFFERAEIRTRSRTCAWSHRARTTRRSNARSTRRRAASANAPWTRCAGAARAVALWERGEVHRRRRRARRARATRWPGSSRWWTPSTRRRARTVAAGPDRPRWRDRPARALRERSRAGSSISRTDNLDELVSVASRFVRHDEEDAAAMPELVAFLSYAALEAGEGQAQAGEDGVQLMTLHSAKGLEFPLVFLAGWRRPVPERAFGRGAGAAGGGAPAGLRRHHPRARRKLVLSYAEARRIHGMDMYGMPSRFLREIPGELLHEVRPRVQCRDRTRRPRRGATRAMRRWRKTGGRARRQRAPRDLRHRHRHRRRGQRRARAGAGELRRRRFRNGWCWRSPTCSRRSASENSARGRRFGPPKPSSGHGRGRAFAGLRVGGRRRCRHGRLRARTRRSARSRR